MKTKTNQRLNEDRIARVPEIDPDYFSFSWVKQVDRAFAKTNLAKSKYTLSAKKNVYLLS